MGNPVVPPQWEETKKAAQALGIEAVLLDIRSRDDIPRAFETANAQHVDILLVGIEALIQENRQLITDLAAKAPPASHLCIEGVRRRRRIDGLRRELSGPLFPLRDFHR